MNKEKIKEGIFWVLDILSRAKVLSNMTKMLAINIMFTAIIMTLKGHYVPMSEIALGSVVMCGLCAPIDLSVIATSIIKSLKP